MLFKNKKYNQIIKQAKEYFHNNNLAESAKTYEKAFAIKVNLQDLIMYGYILIDLGQYQKSEELFKDLTLDFDFTEINYALANIYERTNRKQDAIEHYEKTITNNPEFEQAHFSLAYIYDEISEDEAKSIAYNEQQIKDHILNPEERSKIDSIDKQKEQLVEKLIQTTSYVEFEMHYEVDAALIGGMVIRIGDRVVDSSIKTKLYDLTRELSNIQLKVGECAP